MKKNLSILLIVLISAAAVAFIISCGGGGGGSSNGISSGSLAFYVTDSPEDDYKQVSTTINSVQLLHTGSGDTCDVLTTPVAVDITDLSSMLQLLNITDCPVRSYNRIHVEFEKRVVLTDQSDTTAGCNLISYKDKDNKTNVLLCSGDTCSIDINGAVNVLASQGNMLALDFELKDFEVDDFNSPSCSVTMKVSPLHASEIEGKHGKGYHEGISGYITSLDTAGQTFAVSTEGGTFNVSYGNVTQQGIDDILDLAVSDQLKVKVKASSIDLVSKQIDAFAIYVKVEGTISNLDDLVTKTFTLTYEVNKTVIVDYTNAEIEGVLTDGKEYEVKLDGHDGSNYLAEEVEAED